MGEQQEIYARRGDSAPLYCACPVCWHAMAQYQVAAQGNGECPNCHHGTMRELAVMNIPSPPVGTHLLCLVCAYYKEWGIFDGRTGVSVCVECRDKARKGKIAGDLLSPLDPPL